MLYYLYPLEKFVKNKFWIISFILLYSLHTAHTQVALSVNGVADLELSKAGSDSHFYYNEIDQNNTDFRVGLSQLNLVSKLSFNTNWSINTRLLLERNKGQNLNNFSIPQMNIQWLSNSGNVGFTIGSFVNPFGSFNQKQISTRRTFIGLPLAYSYYTNISPSIGYLSEMGDVEKIEVNEEVQWGSSILYYGGYTSGALFSWSIKPSKLSFKLALTHGSSNKQERYLTPLNFGVIGRLKYQPSYFWEQGFSASFGSFTKESDISEQIESPNDFRQALIGTDFKLGKGFFEFSGEVMIAQYHVPHYDTMTMKFNPLTILDPLKLNSFSAYLDVKYEFPFIPGSYVAYRIDQLRFGKISDSDSQNWDNNISRHSIALGYHLSKYLLARVAVSKQATANKSWNNTQNTLRLVLTVHY